MLLRASYYLRDKIHRHVNFNLENGNLISKCIAFKSVRFPFHSLITQFSARFYYSPLIKLQLHYHRLSISIDRL